MKFEEVIEHLRNGKKVTLKNSSPGFYIRAILPSEAPDRIFEYQLICNNSGFDEDFIEDEFKIEGLDLFSEDWICL